MRSFKKKGLVFLLCILFLLAIAAGCAQDEAKEPDNGEDVEEPDDEAGEVEFVGDVVIGYSGPLSGLAASYGEDCLNGVIFACEDINAAGGLVINGDHYRLVVVEYDDRADPTEAVSNARRLKDQHNAIAIFNPVATCILPTLEINTEEGNEFIMMGYTSTPEELRVDNDLVIWIPPSFTAYVQSQSELAWEQGWRTLGMLITAGAYGDVWHETFKKQWVEVLGGEVVAEQRAQYYGETDFSTQITAVLAQNPDFVILGGPSEPTALVVEQIREMGYEGGLMFVDQPKINYVAAVLGGLELLENTIAVAPTHAVYSRGGPIFTNRFAERFNPVAVVWENALNYNAMMILARAMEKSGSVDDPYAIRAAFPDALPLVGDQFATEYVGVFDSGRLKGLASIMIVKDGEYGDAFPVAWFADSEEEFQEILDTITVDPEYRARGGLDRFRWLKKPYAPLVQ